MNKHLALRLLKASQLKASMDTRFCIINNFETVLKDSNEWDETRALLVVAAKSVGCYSGNINYPIKHATLTPAKSLKTIKNLWDLETQFGMSRQDVYEEFVNLLAKTVQA